MAEVQSLVSDPRVYSIDGPMCRWSLKARGPKAEFMRKQTRWLRMTGKSETVSEYPASLVVAMLSAIKRQTISDGAIRIGELHFAGPVPDEQSKLMC